MYVHSAATELLSTDFVLSHTIHKVADVTWTLLRQFLFCQVNYDCPFEPAFLFSDATSVVPGSYYLTLSASFDVSVLSPL